jgi:hypothetical protein
VVQYRQISNLYDFTPNKRQEGSEWARVEAEGGRRGQEGEGGCNFPLAGGFPALFH